MLQNWKDTNLILQQIYVNPSAGVNAGSPQANVHIGAGIAAVNGAPLMVDPGVLLTTAVNGAIETDGTHFYWTDSTNTRRQLDQQASSPTVPFSLIGTNAKALAVGQTAGAVNPAFTVDTSVSNQVTGVLVRGRAAAAGASILVTSSGTNENLTIDAKGSGTITLGSVSTGAISLAQNTSITGTLAAGGAVTVTSNSTAALTVGANGATNPVLTINANTGSVATGIVITGAAAGANVAILATSSQANEGLTIDAKGSGGLTINNASTTAGLVTIGNSTSLAGATINGLTTILSASASSLTVGANGATNPVLKVDASTGSVATGLSLKGAAAASGVALLVISSGTNESLTIDAKGTGNTTIGGAGATTQTGLTVGSAANAATTVLNVISTSANAYTIGRQGSTNPVLQIDSSVASNVTGLVIQGQASGGGVVMKTISSATNDAMFIDGKGTGTLLLNTSATNSGLVTIGNSTSLAGLKVNGATIQNHGTAAINSTATATAAQVATGYITSTSAAATTITLPTGTLLGTQLGATQGTIHYLTIDNTAGANTVTVAVAVNGILSAAAAANGASQGLLTIPSGVTGQGTFMLMFSSASAYTFTRIA